MTKNHLKRVCSPRTWKIKRKASTFITRPMPGAHPLLMGMPLNLIVRDMLNLAHTTREVKKILQERNVLVDGIRRKNARLMVGLMDVVSFPDIKKQFRILFSRKGYLQPVEIDKEESNLKPSKIIGKRRYRGKYQISLDDGKNLLVDKNSYKRGDTVVLDIPKQQIKEHLPLERNMHIYLIGGKHIGDSGVVQDIQGEKIRYKSNKGDVYETLKEYAFVIGKDKPTIKMGS